MKLLRPLAGYTLQDHKTNDFISRELKITGILDKIDEYRLNWHLHLQRMPQNRIPLKPYHYRPQGRRTIDERNGRSKHVQLYKNCRINTYRKCILFVCLYNTEISFLHIDNLSSPYHCQCKHRLLTTLIFFFLYNVYEIYSLWIRNWVFISIYFLWHSF